MQNELIIVSEYCDKCHIEPSFIEMLQEIGLMGIPDGRRGALFAVCPVAGCGTLQPYVLRPVHQHRRY